jgi:hypothetical protein
MLGQFLLKEWREQRAVVLGLTVAVPVLLTIAAFLLPSDAFESCVFPTHVGLACLAIAVFSISADLVPGEHVQFLRRLPWSLSPSFLVKLAFFLLAVFGFAAYGYLVAGLTSVVAGGSFPDEIQFGFRFRHFEVFVVLAVLWIFAVTCWIPRGILALPATVLLFVLLAAPVVALATVNRVFPGKWSIEEVTVIAAVGALLAARFAFVRGKRFGGRPWSAAKWGLAVPVLCALPFWTSATTRALEWGGHLGGEPRILDVLIGEGGRYAFVNRYRAWPGRDGERAYAPMSSLVLDLETGEARDAGRVWFRCLARSDRGLTMQQVIRSEAGYFDGRTGSRLGDLSRDRERAALRASSPYRLPDGRRAWLFDGSLECDTPDGGVRALMACSWGRAQDFGICAGPRVLDLSRLKTYTRRGIGVGFHIMRIRPGRWLLKHKEGWQLLDPDTEEREQATCLDRKDRVNAILDDGRALVRRHRGPLVLLDPEIGDETLVSEEAFSVMDAGQRMQFPARTPGGHRLFYLVTKEARHVARFDADRAAFAVATGNSPDEHVGLVACLGEEHVLVADDHRLLKLRFGTDDREVLYRAGE